MFVSVFCFSLMNVFVKQVSHLPAMEILFFRGLISAIACLIGLQGTKINPLGNNHLLLFLRGAAGTIALFCYFITLQNIPLASAVILAYLSPIFSTIIAIFVLGEKVSVLQWSFFLLSFMGVIIIKGFDTNFPLSYLVIGIIAALFSGIVYNLVRSFKEKEHPLVIVLHFQIVSVIAGAIFAIFDFRLPIGWDWVYLFLIGILTQIAQFCLTKALQSEKVAQVSIINYTGMIYAIFFGWFIFGETYSISMLIGFVLIMSGVVLSVVFIKKPPEKRI